MSFALEKVMRRNCWLDFDACERLVMYMMS